MASKRVRASRLSKNTMGTVCVVERVRVFRPFILNFKESEEGGERMSWMACSRRDGSRVGLRLDN